MKLKKTMKVLSALTLSVILSMGSLTTVFAAQGPITGDETNPAKAVITKDLQMPEGTTTPNATFTFKFAKKSVDGTTVTDAGDSGNLLMPKIDDKSVTFAATDTGNTALGIKSVTEETTSLFDGITWPHAGVYEYTVTEQSGTYTTSTGETMTYSNGSYDIAVYVANGTGGLYISDIGTTIVVADHTGQSAGDKTDPTTSTTVVGAYSAMVFTNQYQKMNGGTDVTDPDDQTLAISKTVAGTYGDHTKYFEYKVTVNQSALSSGTTTYKGYVVENNSVVTSADNGLIAGTDITNGDYINFPSGTEITVNLKHGQTLAFIDNEVGSNYVTTESAAKDYTPKASIIVNGAPAFDKPGTESNALTLDKQTIGESTNSAAFTNTYKTVTPTGISLNNLPFVIMIALAAVALVAYVVVKSRKSYSK